MGLEISAKIDLLNGNDFRGLFNLIKNNLNDDVKNFDYRKVGYDIESTFFKEIKKMKKYKSILNDFVETIISNDRLLRSHKLLEFLVEERIYNHTKHLKPGDIVYRGRKFEETGKPKEDGFYGYNKKESFIPPANKTRNMRANFKNIPYLYCSNNPYVAAAEVRPKISNKISMASIQINEDLSIYDFSTSIKSSADLARIFMNWIIGSLYSKPVTSDDDPLDYFPTQYIADYIKKLGYDGIAYDSNFADGFNYCIFNYSKCEAVKSNLYNTAFEFFDFEQIDKGEKLDLENDISKLIGSINGKSDTKSKIKNVDKILSTLVDGTP